MGRRVKLTVGLLLTVGCGPGLAADGDDDSASETDSGDGDGDPGDGDPGDGDPGDGDGDSGDGDGDGDGDPWPPGCEPQDASSTSDMCGDPLWFAWTGLGCEGICGCEGVDCPNIYPSMADCLVAHEPDCGYLGLDTCWFESQTGPTSITGTLGAGPTEYRWGAFGLIYGEGPVNLHIAIATDHVALANHLWNVWDPPATTDVLVVWGGQPTVGVHEVYVQTAVPLAPGAMGTLTITAIVAEGDFIEHQLVATLDVSEGDWELHGELTIPGCQRLEQHLP